MRKLTKEEFIERARKAHGNKYDYSKVEYKASYKKVEIVCPVHGSFFQIPKDHMKGVGCFMCDKSKKSNTKEFIQKARKIHGNKYIYDKSKYISAVEKICITCPIHGDFWQKAAVHLRGHGCGICANEKTKTRLTMPKDEFIQRAKEVHPSKNYDYSKVDYLTTSDKVCIICPEHGEFWQIAHNHLNGSCCPNCQVSFGENLVKVSLDKYGIDYIQQYKIKNENMFCRNEYMIVDFYLPRLNTIIEYNGVQHYKPIQRFGGNESFVNQIERDNSVRQYCKEHKIKLIEIPYTQKKNIDNILKKELKIK